MTNNDATTEEVVELSQNFDAPMFIQDQQQDLMTRRTTIGFNQETPRHGIETINTQEGSNLSSSPFKMKEKFTRSDKKKSEKEMKKKADSSNFLEKMKARKPIKGLEKEPLGK